MSPVEMQQLGEAMAVTVKASFLISAISVFVGYVAATLLVLIARPYIDAGDRYFYRKFLRARRAQERRELAQ